MIVGAVVSAAIVFVAVGAWGGGRALGTIVALGVTGVALVFAGMSRMNFLMPFQPLSGLIFGGLGVGMVVSTVLSGCVCALLEKRIAAVFGRVAD
jgi:hypothetical protein